MSAKSGHAFAQKALAYLVDEVSLGVYVGAFVIVVVGCGWTYALLSPLGQGVDTPALSLLDGIYFSVVTISSLGYGDLHPVGISRLIACFEVLFGLSFMGIVIAKITSRPISYHVRRLFVSDAQRRLDEFAEKLTALHVALVAATRALGLVYQKTPEPRPPGDNSDRILFDFRNDLARLHTVSIALEAYFSLEVEHDDYFSIVPSDSVRRLGVVIDDALYQLGQLIISLPPEAKPEVLNVETRRRISETLAAQRDACRTVQKHSRDVESAGCFRRIEGTCDSVLSSHFATPTEVRPIGPPDQVVLRTDIPQGHT